MKNDDEMIAVANHVLAHSTDPAAHKCAREIIRLSETLAERSARYREEMTLKLEILRHLRVRPMFIYKGLAEKYPYTEESVKRIINRHKAKKRAALQGGQPYNFVPPGSVEEVASYWCEPIGDALDVRPEGTERTRRRHQGAEYPADDAGAAQSAA